MQEDRPALLLLQIGPEAGQEASEEEALRGHEGARQPCLEEADAAPPGAQGAREEGGHAQRVGDDALDGGERVVVERAEAREDHGRVHEEEDLGQGREGTQPEGEEGAAAGRVGRMECGAREGSDKWMSARSKGRDGREGGGQSIFFAGEEDGRDECPVEDVSQVNQGKREGG